MFPTAEVRWFWQGDVPDAALTWLRAHPGGDPAEETRTDHYLIIEATDTLGVKLREGHIEVKQRTGDPRLERLADGTHGLTERWVKWSFGLARERPVLRRLTASRTWVGIRKTRWLKEYQVSETGAVEPRRQDESPARICAVEITRVEVLAPYPPSRWWTMGLEASGDRAQLMHALHRTAADLLGPSFPGPLTEAHTCSYPQWLRRIPREEMAP